jgi:hypothetical protein
MKTEYRAGLNDARVGVPEGEREVKHRRERGSVQEGRQPPQAEYVVGTPKGSIPDVWVYFAPGAADGELLMCAARQHEQRNCRSQTLDWFTSVSFVNPCLKVSMR